MKWRLPFALVVLVSLFSVAVRAEISRFSEIEPGVFRGSKPTSPSDFELLKAHGIKTILNLQILPWDRSFEREQAESYGIQTVNVDITSIPISPSHGDINEALQAMADPSLRPIYVHCKLGRDRTGMIVGLHRVFADHWTPEEAYREMCSFGFNESFIMAGLRTAFWDYTGYRSSCKKLGVLSKF